MSCRHPHSWIICGGHLCWCPDCGAIRKLKRTGANTLEYLWTRWIYPKGADSAKAELERQRKAGKEE